MLPIIAHCTIRSVLIVPLIGYILSLPARECQEIVRKFGEGIRLGNTESARRPRALRDSLLIGTVLRPGDLHAKLLGQALANLGWKTIVHAPSALPRCIEHGYRSRCSHSDHQPDQR